MRKQISFLTMAALMTSFMSFGAVQAANPSSQIFTDVPASSPYYQAITWLTENGVIQGYGDGTYRPNNPVNRAEMLKMIFIADGNQKNAAAALTSAQLFPDTSKDQWYAQYVALARQRGTVQGYPDGTFRPSSNTNKAEAYKIVLKEFFNDTTINFAVTHSGLPGNGAVPADVRSTDWFANYINFAAVKNIYNSGWTQSNSGVNGVNFYPSEDFTRGELALLIYRAKAVSDNFPNNVTDTTSVFSSSIIPFNVTLYNYHFAQSSGTPDFAVTDSAHPNATFSYTTMYPQSLLISKGDAADTLDFYNGANQTTLEISIEVRQNPKLLSIQDFFAQNPKTNLYLTSKSNEALQVNALPAVWFHSVSQGALAADEVVAIQFDNAIVVLTDHGSVHEQDGVFNYMVRNFWFKNLSV